ncbi:MAG TPA: lysylphosphatidylglycerol synthase domain-containing protein, partial [Candidatus Binataceae bacterium]|nr:lysylphosphatidylglycerol synthase domain-containing protein [Candidatus Binataceae bacterium]
MRRIETFLMVLALGFYAWFLRRLGLGNVFAYVRLAGWALLLTCSLETVSRVANTLGWRATIVEYPRGLSFGEMFLARIAGEAIDYVTPSAQLGGQFLMALMVRNKLPIAVGLASVIVAALAEGIGQIG